jgi:hypothetical protein
VKKWKNEKMKKWKNEKMKKWKNEKIKNDKVYSSKINYEQWICFLKLKFWSGA